MKIHQNQIKSAEKRGFSLDWDDKNNLARIRWPEHNLTVLAPTVSEAVTQIKTAQQLTRDAEADSKIIEWRNDPANPMKFWLIIDGLMSNEPKTPLMWAVNSTYKDPDQFGAPPVVETKEPEFQEDEVGPAIDGVPTNGATAYERGFTAADCPFAEDEVGFSKWNEGYDEAADKAVGENKADPDAGKVIHSVVKETYRSKYAEAGHPGHCGDELALKLNELCKVNGITDMGLFEAIMEANSIDTGKYNKTSRGWQGRLRMTGRNILARVARERGGLVEMPESINGGQPLQLSEDWINKNKKSA